MITRQITQEDKETVFALYRSVLDCPGCTWTEDYPAPDILEGDIEAGVIFGLFEENELAAVTTVQPDPELAALPFWDEAVHRPAALERLAVVKAYQGRGYGKALVGQMEKRAQSIGYDGIRLIVGPENQSALRLYQGLGYQARGSARLYDMDWLCMDKRLLVTT